MAGPGKKGPPKGCKRPEGAGRKKGVPNRHSNAKEIREYLLSLHDPERTTKWLAKNYSTYLTKILMPLLPKELPFDQLGLPQVIYIDRQPMRDHSPEALGDNYRPPAIPTPIITIPGHDPGGNA